MFDVFNRLDDPARLYASLVDIDFQALALVSDRRNQARLQNRMNLINANWLSRARPAETGTQRPGFDL
jgi:hypothetical protein